MDTTTLKQILLEEMQKYTGKGLNDDAYLTTNDTDQIYTVIDIATVRGRRVVGTVLVARLDSGKIVIEVDHHDKTLFEALRARGVATDFLVLAYRGDSVPA